MLEGFVEGLVEKYVAPYADVDPQKLCVAARAGNVVLKDLKLKPAAFDALEFPLTVKSGTVGELSVEVSWSALRASPAKVLIKDVFLVVGPSNSEADSKLKAERLKQEVADDLRDDEDARILRVKGASPPTPREQSFAIRLFSAAVSTLHVSIANVHIRYEDCTSNPDNAFAGGVTLDKLEFVTTDAQFRPAEKSAPLEGIVHKLLQVSGLSMYWQHSVDPWTGPPASADDKPGRPYHVIHPLSAEVRLGVNGKGEVTGGPPRVKCEVTVGGHVDVCVDCATMRDIASVVDAAVVNANRARVSVPRPTAGYKQAPGTWWRFAIACVQAEVAQAQAARRPGEVVKTAQRGRRYLGLFKRKMRGAVTGTEALSAEEAAEMRALEGELPVQVVLAMRGRAEEMVDAEELAGGKQGKANGEGGEGLLGRLLQGWRREGGKAAVEVGGVELEVGEGELLGLCGGESEASFDDLAGAGAGDSRYSVRVRLGGVEVQVCDRLGKTGAVPAAANGALARLTMRGWEAELEGKAGGVREGAFGLPVAAQLSVEAVEMQDLVTHGTVFPKVMEMGDGEERGPLLVLRCEDLPPNSPASYLVSVEVRGPRMVYSAPLVSRVSKHLTFLNQVDMRGVTALVSRKAAAGVEQQRLLTQRLIRHAVEERRPVDLRLELRMPEVLMPQALCPEDPAQAAVVLFRGGRVTASSEVQGEGGGPYDICRVRWSDVSVEAGTAAANGFAGGGECVLAVEEVTWEFKVLVNRNDMAQTQLVVRQAVPSLRVAASSSSLRRFTAVSVAVTSDSSPAPPPKSLEAHEVSTLVSLASSTLNVLDQAWDTMRRREIGMLRSLQGDKAARLRTYADWQRVDYQLEVGEVVASLTDRGPAAGEKGQELLRVSARGYQLKAMVRSLDATVEGELREMEVADLAQDFGENWGLLVGSRVASSGRAAEAVVQGSLRVWNQKSPDRAGVDVEMKATVGQLYVGCNLQTLGKVQNCVAVALEQGLQGVSQRRAAANGAGGGKEEDAVAAQVEAAARGLAMAAGRTAPRKLALRFEGAVHAVEVALYTERAESVFQVARLEAREYAMTNSETRRGRIEVEATLGALRLVDMTPQAGDKYAEAVVAHKAALHEGKGEGVAWAKYVHYGRGEAGATDGLLEVSVARVAAVAAPRFIAEVVTYVHRSAVFRSNFAAISRVLSNTVRFRQRMDAAALTYGYKLGLGLRLGGLQVLCPEASGSDNCVVLDVPAVEGSNEFVEEGGRAVEKVAAKLEGVRVVSRLQGKEEALVALSATVRATRQLQLAEAAEGEAEMAVVEVGCEVAEVAVTVAQAQVALFWRAVFASIAEVKAAWSWQGQSRPGASKSVLDIPAIREAVQGAVEGAALAEKERQASTARARQHSLDLQASARLRGLSVTILAPPTADGAAGAPQARLELSGLGLVYRGWSDTSYAAEAALKSLRLLDVDEASANVHKTLLEPYAPDKELLWAKYMESSACDGDLTVEFGGVKVNVAADPIFAVLNTVFDAFSSPTPAGEEQGDGAETESQSVRTGATAEEVQSAWGEACMQARLQLGPTQLTVLQDCSQPDTARMVLSLAAVGTYWGSEEAEKASLTLNDLQLYTLTADLPEPLHILDRTSVCVNANRAWNVPTPGGGDPQPPSATVSVVARTLDLVVTYQDLKRIFGTVKVFQAACSKSGFVTSSGVQWLAAMMERDEEEDPVSAHPTAPYLSCPTTLEVRSDVISLCLINDCMGWTVPFATATAKTLAIDCLLSPDGAIHTTAQVAADASFYNIMNTCFEPIMEPWTLKVEMTESPGRVHGQTKVSADSRLELNISEMHMRGVVQTVESWLQDSKTWGEPLAQGNFSPYRLRNEAGVPLTFWLGSSLEPPDAAQCTDLASGGEEAFQFSSKRVLQARQRDMSIEFHTLSIRFDGIVDVLTHVPVDITGVHMLPLGDLRAVAEIHNDSGSKIIAVQSTFKIYNKTATAVEAAVTNDADGASSPWSETFAGDFHGCVPLHLSDSKFLRIRPAGGKFGYCAPFKIPTAPVTGESVFVACAAEPGADADCAAMYFRVRLDAKRPVGGHEEHMRIVVSIHPALRIQNVLPYPLQVAVLAAGSKAKLAAALTAEGQVEQLHCADLTAPLMMSVTTTVFQKVKEAVTVFHPDSSVGTAKVIELLDDQGCPLQLGVETTTSAWGDLTVVFFAQYLVRNFSTLPLIYAQFARTTIKPSAGQIAPADSTQASPAHPSPSDQHERNSLHAVYAIFGPRSPFSGKVVLSDPPLADKDVIANADQLRGNVALIRRGVVPFTVKARRAAAAGAIGVIFINSDDTTFLAEGDSGPGVRIPCVMLTKSDGEQLASGAAGGKFAVVPEAASRSQRATSQLLEWKRVVKAEVRSLDSHFAFAGSPDKKGHDGKSVEEEEEEEELSKEIEFPDAWMEVPGDAPFMFSFDSIDLTGNKVCFCVKGSEWGPPFSLESMGTNGVLEVPGKPSEVPSLKGSKPVHEFGLAFELGVGQFSRSKMCSIVPRYTVVNRVGFTLQLVQAGLEGEANAVVELKDGELLPFHWLDDRKGKTIRARVVPTIGTHESFTTGWSGPLQPEQVGSFSLRFPPEKGSIEDGESLRVLVVVKLRKSASFLVFRRESDLEPQYAVDNKSSRRIKVWQVGSHPRECGHILHPGNRVPFCWDRPHDQHVVELAQQDCKDTINIKMDKFGSFRLPGTLKAQLLAEGATRTLVVRDAEGSKAASSVAESRAEETAKYTVLVEMAGVGVSVIDAKLEEVLYLALMDVSSSYRNTRTDHEFEFKLGRLQIDNQTDKGPEIVLAPDESKSEGRETLHLSMVKSKLYKKMSYFNYFAIFVREMDLDLEETFIMRLLDAAQNVVDSSTITVPEEKQTEDLRHSGYRHLRFLRKEWTGGEKMYFEMLQLHPVVVNLSFYGTGAMMQRASTEGGGLSYNPMFAAMKALGVVVTNIDRAPIALNALMLERPFATQQELVSSIRKHYRSQLITQLYKLVGSFEFLGNPVGLVNNLGTGMHDFFYEPAQGLMKSPADFAKGMSKGSASLFKNMNYGVFNAASKITGSMSKTLVQLSGDEEYIKKRQETQSARLKQTNTNLAQGRQELANEVSEGFLGIFAKPIAGAKESGASGFFSGLGKGLLGAVVKPTAGLMDLTSQAAEGVRNTSKTGETIRRIRPPRVNLGDGILRHYDARSAHGCDAMRRIRDGAWKDHRYIGFCALEGADAVLVTDKHVCMHDFKTHAEKWEVAVTAITQVAVSGNEVSVTATGGKGGPKAMKCTDARYAEYLGEAVRRAVSLASTDNRRGAGGRASEYML